MFGTAFGFSLTRRQSSTGGGGGGGGTSYGWKREPFPQTVAFAAGLLELALTSTPADADAVIVYSGDKPIQPGDYTLLSAPSRVRIEFSIDPATDTDTGTWNFWVQYPYTI